ncbi:hypothetical protein IWZ03DRAFT_197214 [Phyllosticta citriasiana]|uniref:Uncharacterized protein n=1 Tax=Phyllosticta citriasiana TaxID=595635 RepID=A0ABR1KND7_9PEZI
MSYPGPLDLPERVRMCVLRYVSRRDRSAMSAVCSPATSDVPPDPQGQDKNMLLIPDPSLEHITADPGQLVQRVTVGPYPAPTLPLQQHSYQSSHHKINQMQQQPSSQCIIIIPTSIQQPTEETQQMAEPLSLALCYSNLSAPVLPVTNPKHALWLLSPSHLFSPHACIQSEYLNHTREKRREEETRKSKREKVKRQNKSN